MINSVDNTKLTYMKVHMAAKWTIKLGLMLLWFKGLTNVTKKLQFIDPTFRHSCLVLGGDLIAATRVPFICSLISCLFFSDEM